MSDERTIWGVHLEWDDNNSTGEAPADIAIGAAGLGDLKKLPANREAFKGAYAKTHPQAKPGAIPVKAGIFFRFAQEMHIGDIVVYPSKSVRLVKIGAIAEDYRFAPQIDPAYPHRRRIDWKVELPRTYRRTCAKCARHVLEVALVRICPALPWAWWLSPMSHLSGRQ